jgi:hypothetical protein
MQRPQSLVWATVLLTACAGSKGDKGDPGPAGTDGQSTTVTAEPPGANCGAGGVKLSSGTIASYVCNGLNGTGSIAVTTEPSGANCASGGVKITTSSGVSYVCNGSGGGVTTAVEPAGSNCANGGVKITSSSGTNYVCNGAAGSGGGKVVLDGAGNMLGGFIAMYQMPDYSMGSVYHFYFDVSYQDASGVIVPRKPDGTLDPFFVGAVYYSMSLCQGTPYYVPANGPAGNMTGVVPAGALVQLAGQSNFYKMSNTPVISTLTPASALGSNGTCGPNVTAFNNVYTLASITAPAATVPGPLAIQ